MNNENIKEILDNPKILMLSYGNYISLDDYVKLKDYITDLKEENEFLKLNNPEMNMEHFRIIKENKRKIDNLRKENERLKELCNKYEEEHKTTFEYWKNQLETNKHPTLLKGEDKDVNITN